ncbi:hypothetical protein [Azorhizobium caulinodans]|uniref:hypothetical protein n=1 Tax=Azorhizobium caulinodans TaxID=7 RepID=UPI002FBDBC42
MTWVINMYRRGNRLSAGSLHRTREDAVETERQRVERGCLPACLRVHVTMKERPNAGNQR